MTGAIHRNGQGRHVAQIPLNPFADAIDEIAKLDPSEYPELAAALARVSEFLFSPSYYLKRRDEVTRVPRKVCIIGGGIAGLTAAFELLEIATKQLKCPDDTIIERRPRCGGRVYASLG
jgi:NADPH-dependent 2,4-dienoyl-CoA reductase/sulfur reductase-like enzyme